MKEQEPGAVVITGASTGIGAACALHLARLGYQVFAGVRQARDGEALQQQSACPLTPLQLDVTDARSLREATEFVRARVTNDALHGLINNAGIVVAGPLEAVPIADFRRQLEVNVVGQVAVTQAFLPMLRRGRGRIINMGSIAGRAALPLMSPYAASKFALEAITDALRLEVRQSGIQVSIIEPGAIATPIWEKSSKDAEALEASCSPEMRERYAALVHGVKRAVDGAAMRAIPVDAVVAAVVHALTSPRPKTRYLVGWDAKVRAWMVKLLPDRLADKLLMRVLTGRAGSRGPGP
jgi:NAD(P)-dependent dehydrogenase (short-subunit alcohol dehydrogenase family)